jgi:hypothetical protein
MVEIESWLDKFIQGGFDLMARIAKLKDAKNHVLEIWGDKHDGITNDEVRLVGGKRRAYLWAYSPRGGCITISGRKVLRKLAEAILNEVGKEK